MRVRSTLVLLAVVSTGAIAVPGPAIASSASTVLVSDQYRGSGGWSHLRFTVPEGGARIDWRRSYALHSADSLESRALLTTADGRFVASHYASATPLGPGGRYLHVQTVDPFGVMVDERSDGTRFPSWSSEFGMEVEAGEYVMVNVIASDGLLSADFQMTASAETVLLGAESGSDVLLATDRDFRGPLVVATNQERAVAGGSKSTTVDGLLFAWFTGSGQPQSLGYSGPLTSTDGLFNIYLSGEPAGDYTFRINVAAGPGRTKLLAADVRPV